MLSSAEIVEGVANDRFVKNYPSNGFIFDKIKQAFTTKQDFETDNKKWKGIEEIKTTTLKI